MYAEILELVISSLEAESDSIDGYTITDGVILNNYTKKEELDIRHSSITEVLNFLTSVKQRTKFDYVKECLTELGELVRQSNLQIEFRQQLSEKDVEDAYSAFYHKQLTAEPLLKHSDMEGMSNLRQMLSSSCS